MSQRPLLSSKAPLLALVLLIPAALFAQYQQAPQQQPVAQQQAYAQPQSACGNQSLCYDAADFYATVTNFRLTNNRGAKQIDATLRFVNKTNQPLILGYVDQTAVAMDDQGNRYGTYYNTGLAGIGLVSGNNSDPKFMLQPGASGDAHFSMLWRPNPQDPVGSNFQMEMTIREINTIAGGAHTLGAEVPLQFQGLANGVAATGAQSAGAPAGNGYMQQNAPSGGAQQGGAPGAAQQGGVPGAANANNPCPTTGGSIMSTIGAMIRNRPSQGGTNTGATTNCPPNAQSGQPSPAAPAMATQPVQPQMVPNAQPAQGAVQPAAAPAPGYAPAASANPNYTMPAPPPGLTPAQQQAWRQQQWQQMQQQRQQQRMVQQQQAAPPPNAQPAQAGQVQPPNGQQQGWQGRQQIRPQQQAAQPAGQAPNAQQQAAWAARQAQRQAQQPPAAQPQAQPNAAQAKPAPANRKPAPTTPPPPPANATAPKS